MVSKVEFLDHRKKAVPLAPEIFIPENKTIDIFVSSLAQAKRPGWYTITNIGNELTTIEETLDSSTLPEGKLPPGSKSLTTLDSHEQTHSLPYPLTAGRRPIEGEIRITNLHGPVPQK